MMALEILQHSWLLQYRVRIREIRFFGFRTLA